MRKYKILISCMLCLVLSFSMVTPAFALGRQPIQPMAWPGRPGGNNDGSEEWLSGSYGEMNGPWKLLPDIYTGKVADLNKAEAVKAAVGFGIIGLLSGGIFAGTAALIANGLITTLSITSAIVGTSYDGNYYQIKSYISGRCMKIEIKTYEYSNLTGYIKTYTKLLKWWNMNKVIEKYIKNGKYYIVLILFTILMVLSTYLPLKYHIASIIVWFNVLSFFFLLKDAFENTYAKFPFKFLIYQILNTFFIFILVYFLWISQLKS